MKHGKMITWGETDDICDTRIGDSGSGHGGILSWCVCLVSTIPDQSIVSDKPYVINGKTSTYGISTHPYPSIGTFTSIVGGSDWLCSLS